MFMKTIFLRNKQTKKNGDQERVTESELKMNDEFEFAKIANKWSKENMICRKKKRLKCFISYL